MTPDLAAEIVGLTREPNADELATLDHAGVGWNEIWSEPNGPVTVGRIRPEEQFFTFAEDGIEVFLIPIRDEFDDKVIDALAWQAREPARCWMRLGAADWLGGHCVQKSYIHETPMPIWRSALTWLAHGGHGAVVLNWPICRLDLMDFEIIAEDAAHARELERWLWVPRPPRPRVLFRSPEARA